MGFRGFVRDLIGIYVGIRFMISPFLPLNINETVVFGLLIFGFSFLFTIERVGIRK